MNYSQAEIVDRLAFGSLSEMEKSVIPLSAIERENNFIQRRERFAESLSDETLKAEFDYLMALADDIADANRDNGALYGLRLSSELSKFLAEPEAAFKLHSLHRDQLALQNNEYGDRVGCKQWL